ncbi:two-component system sensor histidine kinase NtrB [Anaerobacillus sp. MEB173]|uniref:two-component system sensor histidine kinase NtrB n=1 Tax=Anaerobacillus sp. MEB173 TaxID=3383345 RepID=UPI003F90E8D4
MNSSLYDRNIDQYKNNFEEMTLDLRILLDPKGEIIDMNENAIRYFRHRDSSFFNYFSDDQWSDIYTFLQSIMSSKEITKKVIHNVHGVNKTVLYKGRSIDNLILLSGKTIYKEDNDETNDWLSRDLLLLEKEKVKKFQDTLYTELDVCLLSINSADKVSYCNKLFLDLLDFNEDCEDMLVGKVIHDVEEVHPILVDIKTTVREIRITNKASKRCFYEDEDFYTIKGIYFEDDNSILVVVYDHSYQKRFENLLTYKQQMEAVTHVAAGVAHELRNPLSVIRGFFQLSSLTNNLAKYYPTIISELDRMNKIIEDFLSVSRKRIEKKLLLPQNIMQSLVYIIRSECLLHDIVFDYQISKVNGYVNVNESMIKQVLLNLLRNTIEAYEGIKERRYFYMNTFVNENEYVVSLEDTGPGMAPDILEQLGKPFFTTKEKGTGVGIPLCKKIIEDHGGTFTIESKEGLGTKIIFTLPIQAKENEEDLQS